MESKANTAIIGAFTLAVLAAAFGFIYWLAGTEGTQYREPLRLVFPGSVTGLSKGGAVLFNGIKVGDVRGLALDPQDPSRVVAEIAVRDDVPIKADTEVSLGFQGLTGVGYVEMVGGSADKPDIWQASPGVPVLEADRSSMQDLMASARQITGRLDKTLRALETLITDNTEGIDRIVGNIETFSGALAQNSEQISSLVSSVSTTSDRLGSLSEKLDNLVGAVDPQKVSRTVDNVSNFTDTLGEASEEVRKLVENFSGVSEDVRAFSQRMTGVGENAEQLVAELREKTGPILDAVDPQKVSRTLDNLERISSAIEPEKVTATVDGLSDLAGTLSARREDIDTLVTRLSAMSEKGDNLLSAVDPAKVRGVVDDAARIASGIDPSKILLADLDTASINQSIDDLKGFAATLNESREDVRTIIANARDVSERLGALTAEAENLLGGFEDGAGEAGQGLIAEARATLADIRSAAQSFDQQARSIGSGVNDFSNRGLRDLKEFINEGRRTVSRLDALISNLERDPSQVIFGGDNTPTYRGQRR
ncbi:MlaD family protein [Afifella pfennigii]|uniref:MlaD family protein n=1 Tax=Afifella pfennigii TaxID=209897 RepID=UPI00047A1C7C|nr:MlaD family protein [Afifella pfennigii]